MTTTAISNPSAHVNTLHSKKDILIFEIKKISKIALAVLLVLGIAIACISFAQSSCGKFLARSLQLGFKTATFQFVDSIKRTENVIYKVMQKIYDDYTIAPLSILVVKGFKSMSTMVFIPLTYPLIQASKTLEKHVVNIAKKSYDCAKKFFSNEREGLSVKGPL